MEALDTTGSLTILRPLARPASTWCLTRNVAASLTVSETLGYDAAELSVRHLR